jgi:hypothetical protein
MKCGCIGCTRDAVYRIEHPRAGELVVCKPHAEGYQTLGVVRGEVA